MSILTFEGIGIRAIAASVPKNIAKTEEQTKFFDKKHLKNFIENTGIYERRVSSVNQTSSDFCCKAAEIIFEKTGFNKEEIQALIFVSQTPDYRQPATSIIMQDRLHLRNDIFTQDINQACSGFVFGLVSAYSLCNAGLDNVLLCVGDTPSKFTSPADSSTSLMFGDAGTACIISKDIKYGKSYFSFNSDGSEFHSVNIPAGGYRKMSSLETLSLNKDKEGNEKTMEQIHMDGLSVFSYSVRAMVTDVKNLLSYAKVSLDDIDTIVLHQANQFLNNKVARKLGVDENKTMKSIRYFGNTSASSIPLTISFNSDIDINNQSLLFTAIGASFTWGTGLMTIKDMINLGVTELE